MTSPLYKPSENYPTAKPEHANLGLWFSRFYDRFTPNWTVEDSSKTETGKKDWINTVAGSQGERKRLAALQERQEALGKALGAKSGVFKTTWHLATGLGIDHPVENGFTFHPTLGLPYLPAAGVKGVLRGWVEQWKDDFPDDKARADCVAHWFGSASEGNAGSAGALIFFDALPTEPLYLTCDIMTPHMGKWYESGSDIKASNEAETLPADWHSPVPVPFLVVSGAKFLVQIAPRLTGNPTGDAQAQAACKDAFEQLVLAFDWLGAGAKTAAGYGRLERQKDAAEKQAEELAEAGIAQGSRLQWENAKLTRNKSTGELTVTPADGSKPVKYMPPKAEADPFVDGLSEAGQKRLKDGKKPVLVTATVEETGNMRTLIALQETPAS